MTKFTGIAYEPHPVTPERKKQLHAMGLQIVDAVFKPAAMAESISISGQDADPDSGKVSGAGTGASLEADGYPSDAAMREAIKAATGKTPGARTGREKLIEQFAGLTA